MLTGQFHIASPSSIVINREDRQRRKIDDLTPLAESISRLEEL